MDDARRVKPPQAGKASTNVAELAARQRGIVTSEELRACGLTRHEIETWRRNGHLHEKHRGVYSVGHRTMTTEARWLAAAKACGVEAVVSHFAAAALWSVVEWDGRPVDVTIPGTQRRKHPGLRIHRAARVERVLHKNIPVTSVARTLADLASVLGFTELRRAVREAYRRGLITTAELARARPKALRKIAADLQPTRSVLEDIVHDQIREAGFEDPDVNVALGPYVPDFRWPHRRLIIEADGAQTHDNNLARHD